jgi:Tfp pilus assembly PilM family ATPase
MGRRSGTTIVFDTFSIQVIAFQVSKSIHTTNSFHQSIPAGTFAADHILQPIVLGHAVAAAYRHAGISPGRAAVVLPPAAAVARALRLPRLRPTELREAIPWEMERYLPYPMDATLFDHQILNPESATSDPLEVMVAAAPRGIIAGIGEALRHAGVTATIVTPRPWALAAELPSGWRLWVDIADAHLSVSLLETRLVHFSRTLPWDMQNATTPEGLELIAAEIERSLHFALGQHPACDPLEEVLLTAEAPLQTLLATNLRARLGPRITTVTQGHPTIEHDATNATNAPFALAYAAHRSPLDLRTATEQRRQRSTLLRPLAVVAPALTLMLLTLWHVIGEAQLADLKLELAPLELVQRHQAALQREEQALGERLSALHGEIHRLRTPDDLASDLHGALRSLSAILASSAAGAFRFEELRLSRGAHATEAELVARARDVGAATRFLTALERDPTWDLGTPSLVHHPGEAGASVAVTALRGTGSSP